jgi:RNA polymerase sigma factor (sigma-70 family)
VDNVASGGSRGGSRSWRSSVRFMGVAGGGVVKRRKFAVENAEPCSDNPGAVRDFNPHLDDFHFAQECLEGKNSSLSHFQEAYRPKLVAFLKKRGASSGEAEDVVENIWSECVAPTKTARPKLERYQGSCALQSWLSTIALNSFLTLKRWQISHPGETQSSESGGNSLQGSTVDEEPERAPLLALMRAAIDTAFQECPPEDFVLLQLAHCDQLKEKELALMFRCDVATICRRLQRAGKGIGRAALRYIKKVDPYLILKWDDFTELCRTTSPSYFEEA